MARFDLPELAEGIPPELLLRLERITRCLRMSLIEYELVDIVADYAVVTAELAFALRYQRHFGKMPDRRNSLKELIEWATEEELLVGVDKKASLLRDYRNRNVHPKGDSFGGIAIAMVPKFVFEVVNSLFSAECKSDLDDGAASSGRG